MQALRGASYLAAASHVLSAVLAGLVIAPGTPGSAELAARAAWIAGHEAGWIAGWAAWGIAGLGLLAFVWVLRRRLDPRGRDEALGAALALAIVGLALEASAHAISALVLPDLARAPSLDGLVAAEGSTRLLGVVLAQIAFVGMTVLVVRALAAAALGGRVAQRAGHVNVACAVAMIACGLFELDALVPVATTGLVLSLAGMTIAVGRAA